MKRLNLTLLALGALLLVTAPLRAETIRFEPVGARIVITGTSTMHDWSVESATTRGFAIADPRFFDIGSPAPAGEIVVPVESIRSDNGRMNRIMHDALGGRHHPEIRFRITSAVPGKEHYEMTGDLTINGVTRSVTLKPKVARNGDIMRIAGSTRIAMKDYGIDPPTALLGTLRTGNDVEVEFQWTLRAKRAE